MPQHIIVAGCCHLLYFLRIPFVDIIKVLRVPAGHNLRGIISPAFEEVHRADNIIKGIFLEDFSHLVLVGKITDLYPRLDLMFLLELCHKGKILVNGVFKLVGLQPLLLKLADKGIIQNQILVIQVFKLREGMRMLGNTDFIHAQPLSLLKKALNPVFVIGTLFKVHVIICSHNSPLSHTGHHLSSSESPSARRIPDC